jgi:hypothetical protein
MKVLAARRRDADDIRLLVKELGRVRPRRSSRCARMSSRTRTCQNAHA